MASVGNVAGEGIRVWRLSDRSMIREFPPVGNQWLRLSSDGKMLVVAPSWVDTATETDDLDPVGVYLLPHDV